MFSPVIDLLWVRTRDADGLAALVLDALERLQADEVSSDPGVPAGLARVLGAVVAGPAQGWCAVLLSPLGRDEERVEWIARLSSLRLRCGALRLLFEEGALRYELYHEGELLHGYSSSELLLGTQEAPSPAAQIEDIEEAFGLPGERELLEALRGPEPWGEARVRGLYRALSIPLGWPGSFEALWDGREFSLPEPGPIASFSWSGNVWRYVQGPAPQAESQPRWLH